MSSTGPNRADAENAESPRALSYPPPALDADHDAVQQARYLREVLENDKVRIGCFFGAGCPLGIYDEEGQQSVKLIPAVAELTERVESGLDQLDKKSRSSPAPTSFKAHWDTLRKECSTTDHQNPTVEDVLSEIRTLTNRRGKSSVLGLSTDDLARLDIEICGLILSEMRRDLPRYRSSYHRFASWVAGASRLFPVELFTPNYDLLFEQALEAHAHPLFDGFVGSREPFFDLASIEHDAIPSRWTRIWKLHGSINWEKVEGQVGSGTAMRVIRVSNHAEASKVMIYPSHLKYDQSRRMPYLAMLDRLREFFRSPSVLAVSGRDRSEPNAPRLVTCGYSFLDEHLNEALLDGLRGNPKSHCFALMYGNLEDHLTAVESAQRQGNLTLLARDGAVIGGRRSGYKSAIGGLEEHSSWLYEEAGRVKSPIEPTAVRCRLGDFHYLGLFLERLCGPNVPSHASP